MRIATCNICGRVITSLGPIVVYTGRNGKLVTLKIGYFDELGIPVYEDGDLCFDCFVWAVRVNRGEDLPRPAVHELKLVPIA